MVAAARYLVDNKYTSSQKLAIKGTSAGGIACGGAIVQHPELFAAAIDNVGMTDMLRFQTTRGGAANISEFGDCPKVDASTAFVVLFEYVHCVRNKLTMPRKAVEDNSRMSLRIRAEEKALLLRAVALKHTDLTDFVVRHALLAAKAVIEEADHLQLSERDSLRVLDLLENPPAPNAKLLAAARTLPKRSKS
jgi:uncharacterized protein (DUF1778 family)